MYWIQTFELGEKLSKDNDELKLSKKDGERVWQTKCAGGKNLVF